MGVLLFPAMREGRFYKFWVYIMASRAGTLYIGMTGFIDTRIFQHRSGEIDGFTKKYKCNRLVYCEQYDDVYVAKRREQQLKGWRREKKIALIEKDESAMGRPGGALGTRNIVSRPVDEEKGLGFWVKLPDAAWEVGASSRSFDSPLLLPSLVLAQDWAGFKVGCFKCSTQC
jgi:putative endonuclease